MEDVSKDLDGSRAGQDGAAARILPWRGAGIYERAFQRALQGAVALQRQVENQRAAARRAAGALLHRAPEHRGLLLRNHPAYGGWWLAALLADEAETRHGAGGEPDVGLATLATEAASALDGGAPEAALVADVTARSWRVLADAQRGAGDLAAAAESLARARSHLRRGTREPLERAALLESSGLLLAARGRRRARACLAAAAKLYARLEERHLEGRSRLSLGLLDGLSDDEPRQAAAELRRGLDRLDAGAEPDLAARARRRLAELRARPMPAARPPVRSLVPATL